MKKKIFMLIIILILMCPTVVLADGNCPLGPDVTKDLYGALKIFNIVAPILCIGYSIYEAIKTISSGDASKDMKKVATRFGKRVLYTIILIFLPILVDQVMQIADVWGVNGTCDLSQPQSNGTNELQKGLYKTNRCIIYNTKPDECQSVKGCVFIQGVCFDTDPNGGE